MSGSLSTPPKSLKRRGLRGFATPMACYFRFNNPDGKSPELPALRAEVREPGRSRPRLFLPAFFSSSVPWWKKPAKQRQTRGPASPPEKGTQGLTAAHTGLLSGAQHSTHLHSGQGLIFMFLRGLLSQILHVGNPHGHTVEQCFQVTRHNLERLLQCFA